jgi:hypothetical protein
MIFPIYKPLFTIFSDDFPIFFPWFFRGFHTFEAQPQLVPTRGKSNATSTLCPGAAISTSMDEGSSAAILGSQKSMEFERKIHRKNPWFLPSSVAQIKECPVTVFTKIIGNQLPSRPAKHRQHHFR